MTVEPKNEAAVCAAVVRFMEQRRKEKFSELDRPDQRERSRPAVELVLESASGRLVMEHTRIESYPKQIEDGHRFVALLEPLETELAGTLPEGKYDLIVNVGAAGRVTGSDSDRVRNALKAWIVATAPTLTPYPNRERDDPKWSVTEKPRGVPFDVTLQRWARPGESRLLIKRFTPPDLETKREDRVNTALSKKLPKLAGAKRENSANESVLVIESDDIALANSGAIGTALRNALKDHNEPPDTIYLVETDRGLAWQLWVMKARDHVFPDILDDDHGPFDLSSDKVSHAT